MTGGRISCTALSAVVLPSAQSFSEECRHCMRRAHTPKCQWERCDPKGPPDPPARLSTRRLRRLAAGSPAHRPASSPDHHPSFTHLDKTYYYLSPLPTLSPVGRHRLRLSCYRSSVSYIRQCLLETLRFVLPRATSAPCVATPTPSPCPASYHCLGKGRLPHTGPAGLTQHISGSTNCANTLQRLAHRLIRAEYHGRAPIFACR